jgi:hypothetical protein
MLTTSKEEAIVIPLVLPGKESHRRAKVTTVDWTALPQSLPTRAAANSFHQPSPGRRATESNCAKFAALVATGRARIADPALPADKIRRPFALSSPFTELFESICSQLPRRGTRFA